MGETPEKQPSTWKRFWKGVWLFVLWLIRLVLALGIGVLLGATIFYIAYIGVPQFYTQVLNPIQVNRVKLDILEADVRNTQAGLNAELKSAQEEIRSLLQTISTQQAAITVLQTELETEKLNREQFQELLQSDVKRLDETTQFQGIEVSELGTAAESSAAGLVDLDKAAKALQATVDALIQARDATDRDLEALAGRVTTAETGLKGSSEQLADLSAELMSISGTLDVASAEVLSLREVITMPIKLSDALERKLVLMQAWQSILKAKVDLLQKNAGYASQSLSMAESYVRQFVALSTDVPEAKLAPIVARMEAALPYIESDPFVAVQDLEIVWHELEGLMTTRFATLTITPAESPTLEATPQGTPEATTSPEPTGSPTPVETAAATGTPPATASPEATPPPETPTAGPTPTPSR
ncbi:MAG: hypothetical protein GXY76_11560 [Chloroflexi bacterium]|nr:hypothetical protein [Chloroflexota bacterium]